MSPSTDKNRLTFSVDFHFFKGKAFCDGFMLETPLSKKIGAKYKMMVKEPKKDGFSELKGLEKPMDQGSFHKALQTLGGHAEGTEFVFEVFDSEDRRIFFTQFNAAENFPLDGYESDFISVNSMSWSFDLPKNLVE